MHRRSQPGKRYANAWVQRGDRLGCGCATNNEQRRIRRAPAFPACTIMHDMRTAYRYRCSKTAAIVVFTTVAWHRRQCIIVAYVAQIPPFPVR